MAVNAIILSLLMAVGSSGYMRMGRISTPASTSLQNMTLASPLGHVDSGLYAGERVYPVKTIKCDKPLCSCKNDSALCRGNARIRCNYLPQLPSTVRYFRITNCSIPTLTRQMMRNLSNFDLETINLHDNKVTGISADAFAEFPRLKHLVLSGNNIPVPQIQACLEGMGSKVMENISLSRLHMESLPENFFRVFSNMSLQQVDLQLNKFKVFSNAAFVPFQNIKLLKLNENAISDVNLTVVANIEAIDFGDNEFSFFPNLCLQSPTETGESPVAFPNLTSLFMVANPLRTIDPAVLSGRCLPRLAKLDLTKSKLLKALPTNFVVDLPNLKTLALDSMESLKRYQPYAFNSSSLRKLSFSRMRSLNRKALPPKLEETFLGASGLEELIISDTAVEVDVNEWASMLWPLTSLRKLTLEKIRRSTLVPGLLPHLSNLQHLMFVGNGMKESQLRQALQGVTSLRILNVQANNINLVTEDTLPLALRQNLTKLDMSINPFACDCDLVWFRRWLDEMHTSRKIKIVGWRLKYRDQYNCTTPEKLKNVRLVDFHPTDLQCALYLVLGIAGGATLLLLVVAALAMYRYRWYIRFYIYRVRRRRLYKQLDGQDGASVPFYRFDAYLAHSSQDIDWIMAELLPLLEAEHSLRVFLEERDTIPGTVVVDNYSRFMDQSARIVLVISDSYNQDGWRLCEFEHILYATIEQQKDVIVVLLGDVDAGRMTRDMRRMLTRSTFLQWGDNPEARETFKNGLKVALRTSDVNNLALC